MKNTLEQCLREGFIDYRVQSDERYVPRIVTNNEKKEEKVVQTLLGQLEQCDEFYFSVAFITLHGLALLKDALLAFRDRPVKGHILASQYLNFTEPRALRELLKLEKELCPPSTLEIRIVTEDHGFHAKGYLFHMPESNRDENYTMILGSSNLTAKALTENQEWNVFFTSTKDGAIIKQMRQEFDAIWDEAEIVTPAWIDAYEKIYIQAKPKQPDKIIRLRQIVPNTMQVEALQGIEALRAEGADRGLLISATGTGKTYLSAFDVKAFQPRRFLFVVHRELIAKAAKRSYENVFCNPVDTGLLTGHYKDVDKKYIFCTIQTLSQPEVLRSFAPDAFDYICVDEVHRAGAASYQQIFQYFQPKFWLGMTATPERTDGIDIYALFHHHIAYEIRLHQALYEKMLVPFHYHGIADMTIDGKLVDEDTSFNELTSDERIKHILFYSDYYGCDEERLRCLVFCSRVEESQELAEKLRQKGRRAVALSGESTPDERDTAIAHLEAKAEDDPDYLEFILTRDIFNEGIDIPAVNQVIMLRPTQSAIIFVQQLGRGLRKFPNKHFLEVLDFIGNYKSNFLLPIALYGDRTYSKDEVRRKLFRNFLPGATTVHFDDIVKEKIFESIDAHKNLADTVALRASYKDLKYKLNRRPLMMDFIRFGDKDPYLFVMKKDSLYHYTMSIDHFDSTLGLSHMAVLKMLSLEIANGRRLEEILLLMLLRQKPTVSVGEFRWKVKEAAACAVSDDTLWGIENVLSLQFFTTVGQKKYANISLVQRDGDRFTWSPEMAMLLENAEFCTYVDDILEYSEYRFWDMQNHAQEPYCGDFFHYEKYSRKDVSRILNYESNREGTLNGYAIVKNRNFDQSGMMTCPIFVTLKKSEDIAASTKYEDAFESTQVFSWMTRSRIRLSSVSVGQIADDIHTRKLLFVKKSDSEGSNFYYLGDVRVIGEPMQEAMTNDEGKAVPVVNFRFQLDKPVEEKLYAYLNQ